MLPDRLPFWTRALAGKNAPFDVANDHCIGCDSDDFSTRDYRAFLDRLGYQAKPFFITEALIGGRPPPSEDDAARRTFVRTAAALAGGAAAVFFGGVQLGQGGGPDSFRHVAANDAYRVLARTIARYSDARRPAPNVARFTLAAGVIAYVLWDDATLPPDVKGTVQVTTYAGATSQIDAPSVRATVPLVALIGR